MQESPLTSDAQELKYEDVIVDRDGIEVKKSTRPEMVRQVRAVTLVDDDNISTTEVGMIIKNPDMTFKQAEKLWDKFQNVDHHIQDAERCMQFVIGDFMLFVEEKYGEAAFQLFGEEDWVRSRNWRWICRCFPMQTRRAERHVRYDHYRSLVTFTQEQRVYLLSRVAREKLTTRQLDEIVRKTVIEELVPNEEEHTFWMEYARIMGAGASTLRDAIGKGKEAAEKELEAPKVKTFEHWIEEYETNSFTRNKPLRAQLRDAWEASRKNIE